MDFELSDDLKAIEEGAREFADRELAPRAAKADEEETFVEEQWRACGEAGWAGMHVPEEYGGQGLSRVASALALIQISRGCASTGVTLSVHGGLACNAISLFGTVEQKKRYFPRLASGEWLGAYSLSEAGSGSDAAALRCAATPDGAGGYVLDGTKLWVSSGDRADLIVVFARTSNESKSQGITAFLVETSWPGFATGKKERKMGIRGSPTVELLFHGLRVPPENVLGQPNRGFPVALAVLDVGRLGIAAQAIGIGQACLDASIRYAKERVQFGKLIGEFESIQWKIAEMATRLTASRLLLLRASALVDAGTPDAMSCSMAKLEASRTAVYCGKEAVQIHGGAGYTKEFPVERYFRDARITEIYEGTTEIQNLVIARDLLKA